MNHNFVDEEIKCEKKIKVLRIKKVLIEAKIQYGSFSNNWTTNAIDLVAERLKIKL